MNNQYIETMNNHRPSLTMWQYYWRAWTFPKEKRASRTEANKVMQGIFCSSAILSLFTSVVFYICFADFFIADMLLTFFIFSLLLAWLQLLTIPGIPLFIRRVHDSGKSAGFPFFLSWFICAPVYFMYMLEKGDEGTNKFGPPPSL